MTSMILRTIGLILVATMMFASPATAKSKSPVVLELFTSQGCSSCPSADKILGKLAKEDDVIALSFHVDYWDYIGWKDTFASKVTTARQYDYAKSLGQRNVYTPQLVLGGQEHYVGSDEHRILVAINQAKGRVASDAKIHIQKTGEGLKLTVSGNGDGDCEAWLFAFDRRHEVAVQRGENSGNKLAYTNVVRDVRLLGRWDGGDRSFNIRHDQITMQKRDGYVIVVQAKGQGPVLAAKQHWLK
ncbi:MAG: DUF1223 domain-containing protein [Alphaproteobacteria bacterium]|jgi:hypothetical protein|nr:DUF1223 domain-containing protein [Alphaproteobacteria bacterium]MBT5159646.1 DUF1223 domain-containing protein [Alphaproteobacteria bacterium]MBT6386934.1 DUF1223 domain-containing protein [Alphaproteobacteria bacterium]